LLTKYARAKVDLKLYPVYRHEILNEKNKEEVYGDVLGWLKQRISQ
jgi:alpha-beta hydrolase superfamily lysophospholipase